jgi:HEAT repeat protein
MKKIFLIVMLLVLWFSMAQPTLCQKSKKTQRKTKQPAATSVEKSKQEETKKTDAAEPQTNEQKEVKKPIEQKETKKTEETPIQNIKQVANISAKITRSSFKSGNATSPSWKVEITIKNLTNKQLELGESLIILETARVFPLYVGNYGVRELEQPTDHVKNFKDRYMLDWGYTANATGFGIVVFPVSSGSANDLFMALLSSAGAPGIGEHEGAGYGQIKPRSERTFTAEIPTPFGITKSELRDQIIVVLPRMRVLGNTVLQMSHTIFRFNVKDLKEGDTFDAAENFQIPLTPQDLRAIVTDDKQPIWLRLFALNWFAETNSKEATDLLLQYATANYSYTKQDLAVKPEELDPTKIEVALLEKIKSVTTAYVLQISSIVNLGTWKIKSSSVSLAALLQKTDNRILKLVTIEALGEIGDLTAASSVRPFIKDSDEAISNTAIEAVGKLKDAESVSTLLEILVKGKETKSARLKADDAYYKAATALGAIGSREAIDGLIGVMRNSKETKLRVAAAKTLENISSAEVAASLIAVVSDNKTPDELKTVVISNLSKIGGTEAIAAIRNAAESNSDTVRRSAITALAGIKDPVAVSSLIALVERSNYPSRDYAIYNLGESKITDSLPVLRRIVVDKQSPTDVRVSACSALTKMQDKQAKETLLSVADDNDARLYESALDSLDTLFGNEVSATFIKGLSSKHNRIRRQSASYIQKRKIAEAVEPLWQAYQIESDDYTAGGIASALIELKFSNQNAIPFLINRLDPKKNKLWYADVRLLRQITGEKFGPDYEYGNEKERNAELEKWRTWWANKNKPQ